MIDGAIIALRTEGDFKVFAYLAYLLFLKKDF